MRLDKHVKQVISLQIILNDNRFDTNLINQKGSNLHLAKDKLSFKKKNRNVRVWSHKLESVNYSHQTVTHFKKYWFHQPEPVRLSVVLRYECSNGPAFLTEKVNNNQRWRCEQFLEQDRKWWKANEDKHTYCTTDNEEPAFLYVSRKHVLCTYVYIFIITVQESLIMNCMFID